VSTTPVEIVGWPTRFVGGDGAARRVFEEPLPPGATVRTLLRGLTARFPDVDEALWHGTDLGEHIGCSSTTPSSASPTISTASCSPAIV
jgi:hypothetical protein